MVCRVPARRLDDHFLHHGCLNVAYVCLVKKAAFSLYVFTLLHLLKEVLIIDRDHAIFSTLRF